MSWITVITCEYAAEKLVKRFGLLVVRVMTEPSDVFKPAVFTPDFILELTKL